MSIKINGQYVATNTESSDDITLGADSGKANKVVPTQHAVKEYVDNQLEEKGTKVVFRDWSKS